MPDGSYLVINDTDAAGNQQSTLYLRSTTGETTVDLSRADGITEVRFLSFNGAVVELYSPPDLRTAARHPAPAQGLWHSLLVPGLDAERIGPDGLRLTPLSP